MQTGLHGAIWYASATPSSRIVNQERPDSCGAACGRQLLRDLGIEVPEALIREAGKYTDEFPGMSAENVAAALNQVQDRYGFRGGAIDGEEHLQTLANIAPWIAFVAPDSGVGHMIVVDTIDRDKGVVMVRDPWGQDGPGVGVGVEASLDLRAFLELWRGGIHNAVWRIR